MHIDDKLLDKLQRLGSIEIDSSKREAVKAQMNEFLSFVENMQNLDLDNVKLENEFHTPLRDDVPLDSGVAVDVLASAPNAKDGFFIVPKIIE